MNLPEGVSQQDWDAAKAKVRTVILKRGPGSLEHRDISWAINDLQTSEMETLRVLNVLDSSGQRLHSDINQRAYIAAFMVENATMIEDRDGNVRPAVYVRVWQRDCDMCEATYITTIAATVKAYNDYYDSIGEGAEGPFTVELLTVQDAKVEREWLNGTNEGRDFRDRVLEAFEEGEYYNV